MIDEQQTVDMVDLVLKAGGEQALGFEGLRRPFSSFIPREPRGPADVVPKSGPRDSLRVGPVCFSDAATILG